MDYKFVLLVVLILALIYIITTGFNNIRIQLSNMRDIILDRIKLNSEDVKIKVDNNIGRCIKEIGESNINFVEQIRKIDNITGQKITNGTENYNTDGILSANSEPNAKVRIIDFASAFKRSSLP